MRLYPIAAAMILSFPACAEWKVTENVNPEGPGKAIDVRGEDGRIIARFIYGEGQFKPYLHVFAEAGEFLTNPGLDREGKPSGGYPHHRGIFVGWKIVSELGTDDLWHMTKGCKMEVAGLQKAAAADNQATIIADVLWRAGRATNGSDLLVREKRTLVISRPAPKRTQIDAAFALTPERDLRLAGDLQHSGVHFRASNEVYTRQKETSYLTEPEGVSKGDQLKWCRMLFPIGDRWYSALQLNAPANPVEEVSTRAYGRFGYFFKKSLKKGEPLELRYRFVIEQAEVPAEGENALQQRSRARIQAQSLYDQFTSKGKT